MKNSKLLLVILVTLLYSTTVSSQLILKSKEIVQLNLNNQLANYEAITIENQKSFVGTKDEVSISLVTESLGELNIVGIRNDVVDNKSLLSQLTPNGKLLFPDFQVATYTGYVDGTADSKVFFTLGQSYFSLDIYKGKRHYILESAKGFDEKANNEDYIFYEMSDILKPTQQSCHRERIESSILSNAQHAQEESIEKSMQCREIDLFLATDFALFDQQNGSVEDIVGLVASVINLVSNDYSHISSGGNSFEITFRLVELAISSCESCDFWGQSESIFQLLGNFTNWTQSEISTSYDLAGLYTGITFPDGVGGLATLDRMCDTGRNFVVRISGNNHNTHRVLTSHEMGHVFGCNHNFEFNTSCGSNPGRKGLIMDPSVNSSYDCWSDGSLPCSINSLSTLVNTILNANCIGACGSSDCAGITDLEITNSTSNDISVIWSGSAPLYNVSVQEQGSSGFVANEIVNTLSFSYTGPVNLCTPHIIKIQALCGSATSTMQSVFIPTANETNIDIVSSEVVRCDSGVYDLEIEVIHQGGNSSGFQVSVGNEIRNFNFHGVAGSRQTVILNNLTATGVHNVALTASTVSNTTASCTSSIEFNVPNFNCDIVEVERFNFCDLPEEWTKTTTNNNPFANKFEWKFADSDRQILNYGTGANASTTKTIDGTCMAYFDDDINTNPQFTGNISLQSKIFNFTDYDRLNVTFKYNFHNFENAKGQANNSSFSFEVFDGSRWVELYFDEEDICPFDDVWNQSCFEDIDLDISSYSNPFLRVRFNYTDGNSGNWTGMIALDNFEISAARGAVLPVTITDFEGEVETDHIRLLWNTKDEVGVEKYLVEKFFDHYDEYQSVGHMDAQNGKKGSYSLVDLDPVFGENLYRLTPVTLDNEKIASKLTTVNFEHETVESLAVYPNPLSQDLLNIKLSGVKELQSLNMFDMSGNELQSIVNVNLMDLKNIQINLSEVPAGAYIIQVQTKNKILNHKVVKL